jgi:hypothetical protein
MSDEVINRVHPRRSAPPPPAGDSSPALRVIAATGESDPALHVIAAAGDSKGATRRSFLQTVCLSVLAIIGISSCQTKEKKAGTSTNPCFDYSELSDEDLKKRTSLGYVESAPTEMKHCGNCNLWLPPKEGEQCGRCQLFKGPVPAEAYCIYWAPQV